MEGTELGGFEIPVMIVGITQIVKQLIPKLSDNGRLVVALVVGAVLYGVAQALPFMSESVAFAVVAIIRTIGYTISVPGIFSVVKRELPKALAQSQVTIIEPDCCDDVK